MDGCADRAARVVRGRSQARRERRRARIRRAGDAVGRRDFRSADGGGRRRIVKQVPFGPLEPGAYREIVRRALAEDLGWGDITTEATVDSSLRARGKILA